MRLREIETRIVRVEQQRPHLTPGLHRCSDDEVEGLISVLRQAEAGEPIDPGHEAWAVTVLRREGYAPCG